MADVNAVNYQLQFVDVPSVKVPTAENGGGLRVINDSYTAAADVLGTDVLVGKLKKGEYVQPESTLYNAALGASTTLSLALRKVSDASITVIIDPIATTSEGIITPDAADVATLPLAATEDYDIIVRIAGGTATGVIKSFVRISSDD